MFLSIYIYIYNYIYTRTSMVDRIMQIYTTYIVVMSGPLQALSPGLVHRLAKEAPPAESEGWAAKRRSIPVDVENTMENTMVSRSEHEQLVDFPHL